MGNRSTISDSPFLPTPSSRPVTNSHGAPATEAQSLPRPLPPSRSALRTAGFAASSAGRIHVSERAHGHFRERSRRGHAFVHRPRAEGGADPGSISREREAGLRRGHGRVFRSG